MKSIIAIINIIIMINLRLLISPSALGRNIIGHLCLPDIKRYGNTNNEGNNESLTGNE